MMDYMPKIKSLRQPKMKEIIGKTNMKIKPRKMISIIIWVKT